MRLPRSVIYGTFAAVACSGTPDLSHASLNGSSGNTVSGFPSNHLVVPDGGFTDFTADNSIDVQGSLFQASARTITLYDVAPAACSAMNPYTQVVLQLAADPVAGATISLDASNTISILTGSPVYMTEKATSGSVTFAAASSQGVLGVFEAVFHENNFGGQDRQLSGGFNAPRCP